MRNSFDERRIALFEPHQDIATNPTLMYLLEALTQAGARVDVMMPASGRYPSTDGLVTRYPFPQSFSLWRGSIRTTLRSWWERIQLMQVDRLFSMGAYDLIFGVNSAGIINGYEYAKRFRVPLVYFSFEIFFRDEISSDGDIREKETECLASRFADLVIIQDKLRAELLAAENGLSREKFVYLPVSPADYPRVQESDYCRKRFSISGSQTIVLHSGSFRKWTYAEELLENVKSWPKDFILVVHTRYRPKQSDKYIKMIQESKLLSVVLSTEPLPADEYEQLVASADIGLVLYKTMPPSRYLQKNVQTIGLSSGKFSYYMKYGIPVISINQSSYEELLTEYNFGENINWFSEMPAALERVRMNYDHHRKESQRLFSERLDFAIYWPRLSARLLEIMK